jgi:alcohol dehydrogenase
MHAFAEPLAVERVRVPVPSGGALIEVRATGLCPSDWPGWKGDDPAIYFPRGPDTCWPAWLRLSVIIARATAGPPARRRERCRQVHMQLCDVDEEPSFSAWGSFAGLLVAGLSTSTASA